MSYESVEKTNVNIKTERLQLLFLFVFSFLLFVNTLSHQYALDDSIVITENSLTKEGLSGIPEIMKRDAFYGFFGGERNLVAGGRYRPLSIATFAVEYHFLGKNPFFSHLVNALLYSICVLLVFLIMKLWLKNHFNNKHYLSIPFLIALLFAAHPIHTEVVANIKGRDEIMGLLGALGAMFFFWKYLFHKKLPHLIFAFVCFFLGLLSKENVITFLPLFALAVYFFEPKKLKSAILPSIGFLALSGLYLYLRHIFTGTDFTPSMTVLNNAYIHATESERLATILFTFGKYLQLLIFPHPLTHDYYFNQIPLQSWSSPGVIISLLLLLSALAYGVFGLLKRDPVAFGIIFFLATFSIVSNLFFNVGTTMSERFMFMPSLGFVLIFTILTHRLVKKFVIENKRIQYRAIIIGLFVLGFSVKTLERNPAWENNYTLFSTDIKYSPNSAKLNSALGGTLIEEAEKNVTAEEKADLLNSATFYLNRAVQIYPNFSVAWNLLGNAHYLKGSPLDSMRFSYSRALQANPANFDANLNFGMVLNANKRYNESVRLLERAASLQPNSFNAWFHLGDAFYQLGEAGKSLQAFYTAVSLNPQSHNAYYRIGMTYGRLRNDFDNAILNFERAIEINDGIHYYYEDLGVAYGFKGQHRQAIEAFLKVIELKPDYGQAYFNLGTSYLALGDTVRANENFAISQQLQ